MSIIFFFYFYFEEYLFTPYPALVLRTIGGIFDFYIIADENPLGVIEQYHQVRFPVILEEL
jgi:hypothetical protein